MWRKAMKENLILFGQETCPNQDQDYGLGLIVGKLGNLGIVESHILLG